MTRQLRATSATGVTAATGSGASRSEPSGLPVGDLMALDTLTVDLPVPESALAIGAHPDDIEFGCGATLAKWAAAGCTVHHLILTDGSKGSWDPDADLVDLVAIRAAECRVAAGVINGLDDDEPRVDTTVTLLGRIDGELVDDVDGRREVCHVMRTVRPAVVLGHDPWRRYRLHPDHREAGFLTLGALVAARDPHFFPDLGLEPHRAAALLLWEPDLPNHVEDATGYEPVKIDSLLAHRSQHVTTMGIDGRSLTDAEQQSEFERFQSKVRRQLNAHGSLASLEAGEAFHLMTDL